MTRWVLGCLSSFVVSFGKCMLYKYFACRFGVVGIRKTEAIILVCLEEGSVSKLINQNVSCTLKIVNVVSIAREGVIIVYGTSIRLVCNTVLNRKPVNVGRTILFRIFS